MPALIKLFQKWVNRRCARGKKNETNTGIYSKHHHCGFVLAYVGMHLLTAAASITVTE